MTLPNDAPQGMPGEEYPYAKRGIKPLLLLLGFIGMADDWVGEELVNLLPKE